MARLKVERIDHTVKSNFFTPALYKRAVNSLSNRVCVQELNLMWYFRRVQGNASQKVDLGKALNVDAKTEGQTVLQ